MGRKVIIELPYEDDLPMHLIDVKPGEGKRVSVLEQVKWLELTNHGNSDELPHICSAAVALFQLGAGSFEDCFAQSIVWMRG